MVVQPLNSFLENMKFSCIHLFLCVVNIDSEYYFKSHDFFSYLSF